MLGLSPFLRSLERHLDELPVEQLRRVLLEHGARLLADQRVEVQPTVAGYGLRGGVVAASIEQRVHLLAADLATAASASAMGFFGCAHY